MSDSDTPRAVYWNPGRWAARGTPPRTRDQLLPQIDLVTAALPQRSWTALAELLEELVASVEETTRRATVLDAARAAHDGMAGMGGTTEPTIGWTIMASYAHDAVLSGAGCTCTPGTRSGMPPVHAEDITCPIHRGAQHT